MIRITNERKYGSYDIENGKDHYTVRRNGKFIMTVQNGDNPEVEIDKEERYVVKALDVDRGYTYYVSDTGGICHDINKARIFDVDSAEEKADELNKKDRMGLDWIIDRVDY